MSIATKCLLLLKCILSEWPYQNNWYGHLVFHVLILFFIYFFLLFIIIFMLFTRLLAGTWVLLQWTPCIFYWISNCDSVFLLLFGFMSFIQPPAMQIIEQLFKVTLCIKLWSCFSSSLYSHIFLLQWGTYYEKSWNQLCTKFILSLSYLFTITFFYYYITYSLKTILAPQMLPSPPFYFFTFLSPLLCILFHSVLFQWLENYWLIWKKFLKMHGNIVTESK